MAIELDNYIDKVVSVGEFIAGPQMDDAVINIVNVLLNSYRGKDIERPDGYYIDNNIGYVIEHFEFDSSEPIAGSLNRKELDRVDKYFKDNIVLDKVCHEELKCDYKYQFYKLRLESVFNKHYNNIESYKEKVREKGLSKDAVIKTIFCIEDTSALGSTYYDDNNHCTCILTPTKCMSFLELFDNSPNLDIVITYSEGGSSSKVTYLDRNNLKYYKDNALKDEDIKLINWNVQVASFSTIIKPQEIPDI